MPKNVDKLIGTLEDITKKIEYALEDYGTSGDDVLDSLNDSIETLIEINDELDSQMEEE